MSLPDFINRDPLALRVIARAMTTITQQSKSHEVKQDELIATSELHARLRHAGQGCFVSATFVFPRMDSL